MTRGAGDGAIEAQLLIVKQHAPQCRQAIIGLIIAGDIILLTDGGIIISG